MTSTGSERRRRLAARSLREVERQVAALKAEIELRVAANPALAKRRRILLSIPASDR